ncbi:MAG: amino acid transporter [Candidatus Rokuibacteriota bacterium]
MSRRHEPQGDGEESPHHHATAWWKVMCLTGVDYFSTLGYQPGIAALAAGAVAPLATAFLVALTLLGALPVYRRVAAESPHGEGSIAMLERLLARWRSKLFVLVLLGFMATDFIITITLSAADATAHIVENPLAPAFLHHRVLVTLALVLLLGAVFLRGFGEAIGIAVLVVAVYLALNVVVIAAGLLEIVRHPEVFAGWRRLVEAGHTSPGGMLLAAALVFPKLALGLSGFETGVAVMPLIAGDHDDTRARPAGRIRGARTLLLTAALIMSAMLLTSSVVTTLLIPPDEFRAATEDRPAGKANGRALAFLAHGLIGEGFGTLYDIATIVILWFAGASAMAGLMSVVPRYLPRYGMAPEWARARRPLAVVFTLVAALVTVIFRADVDAQGGAYATGVLVLMTSAAVAVALSAWRRRERARWAYAAIVLVFAYTTVDNVVERPEGVKIASCFVVGIVLVSFVSRALRATELRATRVDLDERAGAWVDELAKTPEGIRVIANHRDQGDAAEYRDEGRVKLADHHLSPDARVLFLEVRVSDASEFAGALRVRGIDVDGYRVLRTASPAVPNAIAATLLAMRDRTGTIPHVYFGWTEGNPFLFVLKYVAFGQGETAPVTREILRRVEPDPERRPVVHVGG